MDELQKKAAELEKSLRAILEACKAETRGLTDEEQTEFDKINAELGKVDRTIAADEALAKIEAKRALPITEPEGPDAGSPEGEERDLAPPEVGSDRWLTRGFADIGEQLQAIAGHYLHEGGVATDRRLYHLNATGGRPELRVATGQSETEPGLGGFMLQKDFQTAIRERAHGDSEILSRVTFTPLSQSATGLKFNVIDEDSRVDGSRGGGVRAFWTDEAAALTGSTMRLRPIELSVKKLTGLMYSTNELRADAPALGAKAVEGFGREIQFKSELAFYSGDGAGKPLGPLGHSGTVEVAKEAGQAANTIVKENIDKMYNRTRNRANAVWMINQDIEPELWNMSLSVGTGGGPVYLPAGGLSVSPFATLMGRPVIPIEYAPTLGTVGDIMLCDWDAYEAIDKGSPESATSMHVAFLTDQDVFRIIYRIDGQPLHKLPLTPFLGTTTTAHFVTLATRS